MTAIRIGTILFLAAFIVVFPLISAEHEKHTSIPMADVKMKNVDGKMISINDIKDEKGTLVVFSCNHCPYVIAWDERINNIGNEYMEMGFGVIVINSNDPKVKDGDGLDGMIAKAKRLKHKFPYVVDATSDVARAFNATRTPEVFLYDADDKLVYHGAVDDNSEDAAGVKNHYLKDALDALLEGKNIAVAETKSIGCSIKFRS